MNIICLSFTCWDFLFQRPQQLMRILSREHQILYVNPPLIPQAKWKFPYQDLEKRLSKCLKQVDDKINVFSPFRLPFELIDKIMLQDDVLDLKERRSLKELNTFFLTKVMQYMVREMSFSDAVLWFYVPDALYLIGKLGESMVCYDCVDDLSAFRGVSDDIKKWETELCKKADVVFTSAHQLYHEKRDLNKHTYFIPNGADYDHFNKVGNSCLRVPEEIKHSKMPVIGFIGSIGEWVDVDLVTYLANQRPNYMFIMIGPAHYTLPQWEKYKNIRFLGRKPYCQLPVYLKGFDVCFVPFLDNEVTQHTNPVKMWEFMAAGKPIVATRLPETQVYERLLYLASDWETFLRQIDRAVNGVGSQEQEGIKEEMKQIARENTWVRRCEEIVEILQR